MGMDVDALRALTPGCAHRIHLNNAGAALMSTPTLDAMTEHLRLESQIGGYEAAAAAQARIDRTYAGLAELVGGSASEIALFDSADRAWAAAFYSIPLGLGTGSSPAGPSTAATSWPTCRSRSAPGPRW